MAMFRGAAAWWCLMASTALGGEEIVWQIGKPDHSWRELAIAGNFSAYPARFEAKPVVFEVGTSNAARDWPFIHPGPADGWAGSRVHPFSIRFRLPQPPQGPFRLRVELVDTQGGSPPTYSVSIGGRTGVFPLPPGGGDASLTNPAAGKPYKIEILLPPTALVQGANEIVLACTEGSWVQYDAVTLLYDPDARLPQPEVQTLVIHPTPFYVRREGRIRRVVDATVSTNVPVGDLALRVEAGGETVERSIRQLPQLGAALHEIELPDLPGAMEVKATATVGGRSKSVAARIPPQKKWKIFVAPSAHTDIGYTDVQPKCAQRHNENVDKAVELCGQFPDFRWNLEVAWQLENYLAARKGPPLDSFLKLARDGKIGVQALYCNILTGLCSHEEACRFTAVAHRACRQYGIPYSSAMISDVPTQEASLPMILANSGIRYFSSGINTTRAFTFTRLFDKCPAWWEGPDGSRVLMMWVPGYAHATVWGMDQSIERVRGSVLDALRKLEARGDYPCDAVFLHGACSDNQPLAPKLAEVVEQWNKRYEYPKIILSRNDEFFRYVERTCGDRLPVFRGSGGTYWEDGAGSSARETALVRRAHETVANGEKLLALARRINPKIAYPAEAVEAAWRNCLLYDEHTWGAYCSIDQPDSEFTKAQWKIKAQFAVDADSGSRDVYDRARHTLASLVRTDGPALVVINPNSWPRSNIVWVKLPPGTTILEPGVLAFSTGEVTTALVRDVPACGYRVLKLGPPKSLPSTAAGEVQVEGTVLESRYYRVNFDPASGAITSIYDKELARELVDPKAPYRLNQYLYVTGGKGARIVGLSGNEPEAKLTVATPHKADLLLRSKDGTLGETMMVRTSAAMTPTMISLVTVWNDFKRIDVINSLTKTPTYEKEAVYFAFPFAAEKPKFRYEIPAGVVCANTDMLPGACLDWFTVQHFVEIEGKDSAITWATPDAPLVSFQDINRGRWQTQLPFANGHLYSYLLNNYWFTNYLAGQGGFYHFRFSITSRPKADRVASAHFGWDASNPLITWVVKANPQGRLTAPAASLVSIDEPNVLLVGARRAAEGDALVLRLWELTGHPATAHVRLSSIPTRKATACNLMEEPQGPLEIQGGAIAVPLRASGLATVRVE
jgi:hypothetical protein